MRIVVAALVIAVAATIYFWPAAQNKAPANGRNSDFPFGVEEQAYAARLQLENLTMSRAENFLNQEVTTLSIELVNGGDRSLRALELTAGDLSRRESAISRIPMDAAARGD